MSNLIKQEYMITSAFNNDMALKALKSQLDDKIFTDLISNEKPAIKLTFLLETVNSTGDPIPA